MRFNEEKFIKIVKPYYDSARSGDWEHVLRVAGWVKEIGQDREDLYLLVAAAYLHDIGWSGVAMPGKINFDEMLKLEPKAAENSGRLISEVLINLEFGNPEVSAVKRLVAAADRHRSEQDDEEIIVDADSLSKLCIEHLREKYQPKSFPQLIDLWSKELPARIKTKKGRERYPQLLKRLKQDVSRTTK